MNAAAQPTHKQIIELATYWRRIGDAGKFDVSVKHFMHKATKECVYRLVDDTRTCSVFEGSYSECIAYCYGRIDGEGC